MNEEQREFDIGCVLTVTTGKLVSRKMMQGAYEILNYLTGENLMTHQIPRALRECRSQVLYLHPDLADLEVPNLTPDTVADWLADMERRFGKTRLLSPCVYRAQDPIDELIEMRTTEPRVRQAATPPEPSPPHPDGGAHSDARS